MIDIMCPDSPDGYGRHFSVRRSSLCRSPALAKFFKSHHYLEGCNMQLTFMSDPAACFQIAQYYLDEGPDIYTKTRLRVYVTMNYRIVDRFIILLRLHLLAKKLALPGLMAMAYDSIIEGERLTTPSSCITIASVVFWKNAGFDKLLKCWCMKHVGHHFVALKDTKEWDDALKVLEPELSVQWTKMLEANATILAALNEEASKQSLDKQALPKVSIDSLRNDISTAERDEMTVEDFIELVKDEERRSSEEEWEDLKGLFEKGQPLANTKTKETLGTRHSTGMDLRGKVFPTSEAMAMVPPETAKARAVLGLDDSIVMTTGRIQAPKAKRRSRLFNLFN